jgi:hypothetical protein
MGHLIWTGQRDGITIPDDDLGRALCPFPFRRGSVQPCRCSGAKARPVRR